MPFNYAIGANDVAELIAQKQSFVLNIVASWCPDCTEAQFPHTETFRAVVNEAGIEFYNLVAQEVKGDFLSPLHEALVESAGGHGYPRTTLWINGVLRENDHIEVTELDDLIALGKHFVEVVNAAS
jgi:thiol-disulfide isomerase/thioredoxin